MCMIKKKIMECKWSWQIIQQKPITESVILSLSCSLFFSHTRWIRDQSSLLVDAVKQCEREQCLRVGPCPGSPALLDPHHLPQLLLPFKCHSDWQWTQSSVIIVVAWWLGQVMPPFQDLSCSICSSWYLTELNPFTPPPQTIPHVLLFSEMWQASASRPNTKLLWGDAY